MSNELTPKQENFCQTYLESGCATTAYKSAYDAENMKNTTIHRKAKELLDNGKITARLTELRQVCQEAFKVSIEQKKRWLNQIIERSLDENGFQPRSAIAGSPNSTRWTGITSQ